MKNGNRPNTRNHTVAATPAAPDGLKILLVGELAYNADRVLALHRGAVAAHGPAREVLTPALIRKLYRVETALADTRGGSVLVPLTEGEK